MNLLTLRFPCRSASHTQAHSDVDRELSRICDSEGMGVCVGVIDELKKVCEPYGILVMFDYILFVIVYIYSTLKIGKSL